MAAERLANPQEDWEYPYDQLGEKKVTLEGDVYEGQFVGQGFIIPEFEDHNSILADNPDEDAPETRLTMEGLFPPDWRRGQNGSTRTEIEYEITIKAKRIPPADPQK